MKSTLTSMILSLGCITVVSGAILAGVHELTEQPIIEAERQARVDAVGEVCPRFDNDPIAEKCEVTPDRESLPVTLYPATLGGKPVGAAVESYSPDGFSGEIKIMYGFDSDGNVTGYSVISHAETPGLGAKMADWFRSPEGHRSVIGLNAATDNLTVGKDGGDVDAITAATITSRAFLDALRRASAAYSQFKSTNSNLPS
ncbi:MAG: RnfABCDGE type electron transport complex subunit G [Duncaniella sp.]|nr:RnfABCDGE type electron transport complex subunit G [Duncaniella sp.]